MTIVRLQHVGMAVADYAAAERAFDRLALPLRDFRNDQGRGFQHDGRILLGNDCWLHVVHNWNPESRVNRFLTSRGEGLEHLALETDDIESDVARLRELGVPIFEDHVFDANDGYEAFVYPDDAAGFTIELIQPHPSSWGYPEDARSLPVSERLGVERLARVRAQVDDVDGAKRRLEKLFGLSSDDGAVSLGNAELQLERGEPTGLASLVLETRSLDADTAYLESGGVSLEREASRLRLGAETAAAVAIELVATSKAAPRR